MKYHPSLPWYQRSSAVLCFALELLLIADFATATLATASASIGIDRDHDQAHFISSSSSNSNNSSSLDSRIDLRHDEQLLQTCSCSSCSSSGTATPTSDAVLTATCPQDYDAVVIKNLKVLSSNGGVNIYGLDPTNYALYQQGSAFSQFSGISASGVTCFNQGSAGVGGVTGQKKMYFVVRCTNVIQSCPFTYTFSATCSALSPSGSSGTSGGSLASAFPWWGWVGIVLLAILIVYIRRRICQACSFKPQTQETPQNPPSTTVPVQPSAVVLTVREPPKPVAAETYKRFCGGCGAENSTSKFCGSCGQKM